ncbi:MAG: hypothetical protein C4329_09640 [Chitinophagaceae bacterium]
MLLIQILKNGLKEPFLFRSTKVFVKLLTIKINEKMRTILVAAISVAFAQATFAQEKYETIEGNCKVVTRDVNVQPFDALKASGICELKLSQGNTESVKIEADENLQEYFTVKNEGSKLVIDMDKLKNKNLRGKVKMTV